MTDLMLDLSESVSLDESAIFRPDGTVPLHIIRPGVGRGRGKHLYEADMLQEAVEQGRFTGWKMYVDHQSPEARKASGGLPRSVRDLGGIIKEAVWDPNVPANLEKGWGQGAVVGFAKPTSLIRSLIEDDPELVEASISATATSVKPVQRGRDTVWLVEGIRPKGSVDWVTEAGAGGRVAPLIEALVESDNFEEELEMLEDSNGNIAVSDEELVEWIREERPDLLATLQETDFKGARPARKPVTSPGGATHDRGGEVPEDAYEALTEALESDEGQTLLDEAVKSAFARVVAPQLRELVEAALEDERDLLRAEGRAEMERVVEIRDMRDFAHGAIAESRLPEPFQAELREKYDIVNGKPTSALDVLGEEDGETGETTKSATDVLGESVESDIARKREQAASLRPTRVRGQGEVAKKEPAEGGEAEATVTESTDKTTGSPRTDAVLQEAGIDEGYDTLYAGILR